MTAAPPPRGSRWRRWRVSAPGTLVSVAVHVAIAFAFLLLWRAMVEQLSAPSEPIAVDLVTSIPGETKPDSRAAASPKPAEQPKPPAPKRSALDEALPPVPTGAAPQAQPAAPSPAPNPTPAPVAPQPVGPKPAPESHLALPPPEPKRAITQTDKNEKANASEDKNKTPLPPAPLKPAEAPAVLTAPESNSTVPLPSHNPDKPKPEKPADSAPQARTDPNATLAAALPMGSFAMPATFRSMLSSQGDSENQEYKGVVYGMLGRGHAREIAQEAQRRGLKGQVIVGLTVDDTGGIAHIGVLQTSGNTDVDAMAVEMVRAAAPFPPPPPGTQHSFTPAIAFGGE